MHISFTKFQIWKQQRKTPTSIHGTSYQVKLEKYGHRIEVFLNFTNIFILINHFIKCFLAVFRGNLQTVIHMVSLGSLGTFQKQPFFGSSNHRMITGTKMSFWELQTICLIRLMSFWFPSMRRIILYPSTKSSGQFSYFFQWQKYWMPFMFSRYKI